MSLFGFLKKEEKKTCGCACGSTCGMPAEPENTSTSCCCCASQTGKLIVKVLGSGCKNCHTLLENTKQAVAEKNIAAEIIYVTDMKEIMEYGVMQMPALVVNETVVSMGKVLSAADAAQLLERYSK